MITELNERSREIFRYIVDSYLETGQPVGSRVISESSGLSLSPASIRNTMADLESLGLLRAPHTSAGRLPTERGLRLYVDGLMQLGNLTEQERRSIEAECNVKGSSVKDVYEKASDTLSRLSACASLVMAPKVDTKVRQIQFVQLEPCKVLGILVMENGLVENRIMDVSAGLTPSMLASAANYMNCHLSGNTIEQAQKTIREDILARRTQLDALTTQLVEMGLMLPPASGGHFIVRGQSRLLEDVKAVEDLERVRVLLGHLEEQETMLKLLESVGGAQGVQIFIGRENAMFSQSGCSLIIAPYKNSEAKIIGAIGVIGPTRIDYGRIIPMVDYTSRVIQKLVEQI